MGVSSLNYYNNRYKGTLSDQQCEVLERLIELKKDGGVVLDIKHAITELPDDMVDSIIENYEYFGHDLQEREKPAGTLEDYQTISVACMYYAGNCILGDSVGMGKTVEVAGLFNILKSEIGDSFRYLVLTEKRPASQLRHEMVKFTGDFAELIPSSDAKDMKRFYENCPPELELANSVVGTHGLIKASGFISWIKMYKDAHKKSPFDVLVIDESSILGNTKTNMVQSFKVLAKYFKRIIFLNATPFESKLKIFYTQLDLLDKTFLPTLANFQKEYCVFDYTGMYPKPTDKYKNESQFRDSVAYRYFASTRRENGARMDGCSGGIITSKLSKAQKDLLKETSLPRMVYDCPNALKSSIEFNEVNVPKLKSVRELLENECVDAPSILIFVQYKEAQKALSEWLTKHGYSNEILNGETKYEDSNRIISGFKAGTFRVLITNVQKALNFGNCDYCIFYTVISNTSQMLQFEGRMTRSFDIYGKNVYILCSEGKELSHLNEVIKSRAKAMKDFTAVDYSVVLSVLLGGNM